MPFVPLDQRGYKRWSCHHTLPTYGDCGWNERRHVHGGYDRYTLTFVGFETAMAQYRPVSTNPA
jgi:hypothetical protein